MNVLITGSTGFLGRHVCSELFRNSICNIILSRKSFYPSAQEMVIVHDFLSELDLANKIPKPIDAIVHMAHAMGSSREEQMAFAIKSTRALLDYAISHQVKTFVLVSSLSVLDLAALPAYARIDNSTPRLVQGERLSAYAAAKLAQEQLVERAAVVGGTKVVVLRPGLIYDDRVMSNAYAGLVKGMVQLGISHQGQIPLVSATRTAQVIFDSLSSAGHPGLYIRHVLDHHPWSMQQYRHALIERGQLRPHGLSLPWRVIDCLGAGAEKLACLIGHEHNLPELFNAVSRAARLKPLLYWADD